jgi:hypothetical protein
MGGRRTPGGQGPPEPYFFVRDPESRGWIWQGDLPDDKRAIMQARMDEHERLARKKIIDDLFDVLRQGGGLMAARKAVKKAEEAYGARIVEDALYDYDNPDMGAVVGHMIGHGHLTMKQVTELLWSPLIFFLEQGSPLPEAIYTYSVEGRACLTPTRCATPSTAFTHA